MKLQTNTASIYATIASNGSVSLPPAFFGRPVAFVEKELGAKLGSDIVIPRVRTSEPLATIPLDSQPLWARAHSWITKRGLPVSINTVGALIKAGKVKLVPGTLHGNKETFVVPASWKDGQKLPKVAGVMPSQTYRKGRVESYATADNGAVTDNRDKRPGKGATVGKVPKAEAKPEPKPAPKVKPAPDKAKAK